MGAGATSGSGHYLGRSTYGGDYQTLAFGSGGVSGRGLMEGMLSQEPLEQLVLNTLLVARPTEGSTEMKPPERSALALQLDYGHFNWESLARPMVDIALDRRPMNGLAVPLPVESLGLDIFSIGISSKVIIRTECSNGSQIEASILEQLPRTAFRTECSNGSKCDIPSMSPLSRAPQNQML